MRPTFLRRAAVGLIAAAGLSIAIAQTPPPEAWVVEEGALQVEVVDTDTGVVLASIDLRDPDADGSDDPPWGLAFSTEPGAPDLHAFVTQQGLVSVLDVPSRTVDSATPYFDVARAIGQPGLLLRGCAASPPRWFVDPDGTPRLRALLDVAGTLPGGTAVYVILDQGMLTSGAGDPVVSWGTLQAGTGVSVSAAGLPTGKRRHKPLYAVIETGPSGDALVTWEVSLDEQLGLGAEPRLLRRVELPAGTAPATFQPGAANGRRLPVMPQGGSGVLENLDTGGRCTPGGELTAVEIAGPGPNSYTLFTLDASTDEIVVVDPVDCSTERVAAEAGARDLALDRPIEWTRLLVANRDDDSLTRLLDDGSATRLPLGPGGPACTLCPISVAMKQTQFCAVEMTGQVKGDFDSDGSEDDIRLSWDAPGCAQRQGYSIYCQCIDGQENCPCACDCIVPDPTCICPGLGGMGVSLGGGSPVLTLQPDPWEPPVLENPWKKLGNSIDTEFDHIDALGGGGVAYGVTLEDEPPP